MTVQELEILSPPIDPIGTPRIINAEDVFNPINEVSFKSVTLSFVNLGFVHFESTLDGTFLGTI